MNDETCLEYKNNILTYIYFELDKCEDSIEYWTKQLNQRKEDLKALVNNDADESHILNETNIIINYKQLLREAKLERRTLLKLLNFIDEKLWGDYIKKRANIENAMEAGK